MQGTQDSPTLFDRIRNDLWMHLRYGWDIFRDPSETAYAGVKIPLKATKHIWRNRRRIFRGTYEAPELAALKGLLRRNDIVLELGAGVGVVSTFIALQLENPGHLHVYEANPVLIDSITALARANGVKFNIQNCAVGLDDGEIEFYFDDSFESSSGIDRNRGAKPARIVSKSFATILHELRPTVVVIDVEGAEKELLAIEFPDYVEVVCGEVHPHIIGDIEISAVFSNLLAQGFRYKVDDSQGRGVVFSRRRAD